LLVLDNFEHVTEAASIVSALMTEASGLRVLVTSRKRLHITGEHEFVLGALQVPRLPVRGVQAARASASVALFERRAQAVQPSFALSDDNVEAVASICAHLDGWPLA